MKFIRLLLLCVFFVPFSVRAADSSFMMAAQLLAAAKSADVQQVQALVNSGADVNYVDSTGLSIVCTALMNNDVRAAQILQMYGADASKCDIQIKRFNNRNKPESSGGLFGGLSSAQSLTLAAAGAAVVAGGLFLLTDVFDPGNGNSVTGTGGDRPTQGGGSGGGGSAGATVMFTVPYSPAYVGTDGKINQNSTVYIENLDGWNPSAGGVRELDFNYFRPKKQADNNFLVDGINLPVQNYLLMMHGYSAFANEYLGQKIFRTDSTRIPLNMVNDAGGGLPIAVRLITDNGVNPTGSAARGDGITYALSTAANADTFVVDKYLNYANPVNGVMGAENSAFDLSGAGGAMNPYASAYDSALGKIVAGWAVDERAYGDFYGFVPNGQLGVFRTGGGQEWIAVSNPTSAESIGTLIDGADGVQNVIDSGDKIVVDGVSYDVSLALSGTTVNRPTITVNGTVFTIAQDSTLLKGVCDSSVSDCDGQSDIAIYSDENGNYFLNKTGGDNADDVFVIDDGKLYTSKTLENADYKNFQALFLARASSPSNYGVIANLSVLDSARDSDYLSVADMPALIAISGGNAIDVFANQINLSYDKNDSDSISQGDYANRLFNSYNAQSPIMLMPAGEFKFGVGQGASLQALDATFENYAPLLYDSNLEHNFMTVVAVGHSDGTQTADSIDLYGNGTGSSYGKLYLSMWTDNAGTVETDDDILYSSRQCGVAGVGKNGIDPWCFSAAGANAEMATAAAAGAVASVKSAFDYMSNKEIFYLLALTADGYLLGTNSDGTAFNQDSLAAYLRNMYSLPPEYDEADLSSKDYLDAFAKVYGYGLINLERAMTPNHNIYYYDGNSIVSAGGNAFWRTATNTVFRPSVALNLRGASVRAPFFDVVESFDGTMSMPRVWQNEFALGGADERGLYMGDVLGNLKTRKTENKTLSLGSLDMSMAFSERAYADNFGGLDNLALTYRYDDWRFVAAYQQKLTDGLSKFDSLVNPILGMASNAITTDVKLELGNFTVGTRLFSGQITDEGLLENDPTISAQYMPAVLGLAQGMQTDVAWANSDLNLTFSLGFLDESDTLLGAYTDGLLDLGSGNTIYLDLFAKYNLSDDIRFSARTTFAKTETNVAGNFVLGLTDLNSNSFALGVDVGNFEFSVSQPLAIVDGHMKYAYADYQVIEQDGEYVLDIRDTYIENLDLTAEKRELRLVGLYRHNFGEFTDGAIGFIYRINPNHTDDFGNESILMLKLNHRLGI